MAKGSLASRTFSVSLLILFLILAGTKGLSCEDRWFGDKCQYQCHCLNNAACDKTTGECPRGCDIRWFGPQCQYRDAAFNAQFYLTDGKEDTCLSGYTNSQTFTMLDDVMFSWMRIVTKKRGLFDRVNITFLSKSDTEVVAKSPLNLKRIYLNDTILYLYGELQDRFKKIRLDFDTPETRLSFCSMQVSSGRNVALKQDASQSSTYSGGNATNAVDGKSNHSWNGGSCTSTHGDQSPYWTLRLSQPVTVNMYTIQGRHDSGYPCIPRYFQMETYYNSQLVQEYKEIDVVDGDYSDNVYPSVNASPIISVKLTVSKEHWNGNGNCALSFCEMQIYGDVECQQRNWGRDCEKDCNCQDPNEKCFVSTGMCRSGCKAGFYGPGCQIVCDAGSYGDKCNQPCPTNCLNNICNNVDGKCTQCVAGYRGPRCEQECDAGSYGDNCNQPCPTNCLNNICNNVDGKCTQCVAGYQGPRCEQECSDGRWGFKCLNVCGNCLIGTCNKGSGECMSGCVQGYKPPYCEKECDPGFHGYSCNQTCPTNCLNNICNNVDGRCTQCVAGYQGLRCKQVSDCLPGFFGPRCANQCSEHCGGDGLCQNINGNCLQGCKPGYRSDNCEQPCITATYGEGCNKRCSVNCVVNATHEPAICEHVYGQCLHGCLSGYSGITCEEISSDDLNLASIIVPVVLGLIVVAALIFGICFWRRRKAYQAEKDLAVNHNDRAVNGPDVAHEHGVHLELDDQPSHVQVPVTDHYDQISLNLNEENSAIIENLNEENQAINEYNKISPYVNVESSSVHEYEEIGAKIRVKESKTGGKISETEPHVYNESEPGY